MSAIEDHRRELEGWHLADLLGDVVATIRLYVVLDQAQMDACALWVAHTWLQEASDVTPYLHVASPEKRSGKTRLLEVLELLVREPLTSASVTPAAIFRVIEKRRPTLLLDEYDATTGGDKERAEAIRGLLNAGHRRGVPALRCVPPKFDVREFDVFCPKVIAGIGDLPDTLADRCVRIELRRRARTEAVQRFRRRIAKTGAVLSIDGTDTIRMRMEGHRDDLLEHLQAADDPVLPDALDDRAQDVWEPLLAIADLAGRVWPQRARDAAIALSGVKDDSETPRTRLLALVGHVMADRPNVATAHLLHALSLDDTGPWSDWWDARENAPAKGAARRLATMLRPFGARPKAFRQDRPDGSQEVVRGYMRDDLADAFARYLPDTRPVRSTTTPPPEAATSATTAATSENLALFSRNGDDTRSGFEPPAKAHG